MKLLNKMSTASSALVIIIFFNCVPASVYSIELITAAQKSAPKYYISQKGEMTGLCVDIIHAVEKAVPGLKISGYQEFIPFKRLQSQLEDNLLHVFFGMKKTEIREKVYTFIDIPLYKLNYVIAIRADDNIKIGDFEDIRLLKKDKTILTVLGSATNRYLQHQGGLLINDLAKSPSVLIKMLKNKRGRFAFYHDLGLRHIIREEGYVNEIKILPVSFSSYAHYTVFSKKMSPEIVSKVKTGIQKIQDNGTLEKIFLNYSFLFLPRDTLREIIFSSSQNAGIGSRDDYYIKK